MEDVAVKLEIRFLNSEKKKGITNKVKRGLRVE